MDAKIQFGNYLQNKIGQPNKKTEDKPDCLTGINIKGEHVFVAQLQGAFFHQIGLKARERLLRKHDVGVERNNLARATSFSLLPERHFGFYSIESNKFVAQRVFCERLSIRFRHGKTFALANFQIQTVNRGKFSISIAS